MCPENLIINKDEIKGYNKELLDHYKKEYNYNYTECTKLIPNLRDKKNYVIHGKVL